MLRIYIQPEEVWDYFTKNLAHLTENLDVVAEIVDIEHGEESVGLQVFVTEDVGFPMLSVEYEDEVLASECAISQNDCTLVVKKCIKMIEDFSDLSEQAADEAEAEAYSDEDIAGFLRNEPELSNDVEHSLEEDYEYVEEREDELKMALYGFILESMGCTDEELEYDDDTVREILDELEDIMYTVAGYTMYRPVIIEPVDSNHDKPRLVESRFDA